METSKAFRQAKSKEETFLIRLKRDKATGVIVVEDYLKDGMAHREGAPSFIMRDAQTGQVTREWWYLHGKLHRDDGPACVSWDGRTGEMVCQEWFVNGCKLQQPEGSGDVCPQSGGIGYAIPSRGSDSIVPLAIAPE
jgi:hypothetical protein